MGSLIFDTSFLIDYQKEKKRGVGPAHDFLFSNQENSMFLPVSVVGEFGEGFTSLSDTFFRKVVDSFLILPVTEQVASIYSRISRSLRSCGTLIGIHDLWLASVALDRGFPLVTNNASHFTRIPDLRLQSY